MQMISALCIAYVVRSGEAAHAIELNSRSGRVAAATAAFTWLKSILPGRRETTRFRVRLEGLGERFAARALALGQPSGGTVM